MLSGTIISSSFARIILCQIWTDSTISFHFFFHCAIYANAIHIILYHCYVVAITAFNEDLLPLLGGLVATIKIHAIMLHSIIRSRLSFFDTTPTGRILSRFSADVETCDSTIPRVVSDVVYCLFEVILFQLTKFLKGGISLDVLPYSRFCGLCFLPFLGPWVLSKAINPYLL